jgi:hypothetical protein
MHKQTLSLQPSEICVVRAAATIYAGYIAAGRVPDGEYTHWILRSIREAIMIARSVDEVIQADKELS